MVIGQKHHRDDVDVQTAVKNLFVGSAPEKMENLKIYGIYWPPHSNLSMTTIPMDVSSWMLGLLDT